MKLSTNVKPPRKKVVGYKYKTKAGEVLQKGKTDTSMEFEREKVKKTYTPEKAETGHKAYGKAGGGTDKEMNRLIKDAQEKKRDVTEYSSKGLHYKAGTTKTERTPEKFTTTMNVTPTIRKVNIEKTPIYEKGKTSKSSKLKARDVTLGGENKKGSPANKYGVGKTKKVKIKRTKSFPKN